MKNFMSKILSVALALTIILCAAPLSGLVGLDLPDLFNIESKALTSGNWIYNISGSNAVITGYSGAETDIIFPSTLNGYKVTEIAKYSFKENTDITSIVIPEGYYKIGRGAFSDCTYLKKASLPSSLTLIDWETFSGCIRLETVSIAEGGTAAATIDAYAFLKCTALKEITIPANYSTISFDSFSGCTKLQKVTIKENSNTAFERTIGSNAFYNCSALTSIVIPEGFYTIGRYAFANCNYLKTVTIPKTMRTIDIYVFFNCIRLESVTLTEGGSNNAQIDGYAFSNCTALKSITIPSNYQNINYGAFSGCSKLSSLTIKENSDKSIKRTISKNAFEKCVSLTSVIIPEGFTAIGQYAFKECTLLKTVKFPKTMTSIGDGTFYNCTALQSVTFTEDEKTALTINMSAFSGCTSLKSITIPKNCQNIGSSAFSGCTNLQTITINNNNDEYFERTLSGYAFQKCSSLQTIVIPEGFTTIGKRAFSYCSSLKSVSIPSTVTLIGSCAFISCPALETITFKEGEISELTIESMTFQDCKALKNVTIPADCKEIGSSAFKGCTALQTVIIKNNDDEYFERSLGATAFSGCTNLAQIHIPTGFKSIGNNCFYNCSSKLVICNTTANCTAKNHAETNSITFKVCNENHNIVQETDIYTINYYANGGSIDSEKADVVKGNSTTLPTPVKTVKIKYNANGGSAAPSSQSFSLNCDGWATSSSATTAAYSCGSSYTPTKDITFYAVWLKTMVNLTSSVPTRSGYTFLGWSRNSSATSASYEAGEKINISENMTLYAVWKENSASTDNGITDTPDEPGSSSTIDIAAILVAIWQFFVAIFNFILSLFA
ncbi:MAG: leucine-rich repeat protein [Clostridia bacterium]|nr:leucine-rich repeat protein [Clostridia bacterium]